MGFDYVKCDHCGSIGSPISDCSPYRFEIQGFCRTFENPFYIVCEECSEEVKELLECEPNEYNAAEDCIATDAFLDYQLGEIARQKVELAKKEQNLLDLKEQNKKRKSHEKDEATNKRVKAGETVSLDEYFE